MLDLGVRDYSETWDLQKSLVDQRVRGEIPDTLIFVEHPHVVTLGRGTNTTSLPGDESGIQIFKIERGGEATYHGPGQLVAYPILKLESSKRDLHKYLRTLEEVVISSLNALNLAGTRKSNATGVWIDAQEPRKIASIGIAVRRWVTYHGFALNVSPDLRYFNHISPCGFSPSIMTSIERELGQEISMETVKAHIASAFERQFMTEIKAMSSSKLVSL